MNQQRRVAARGIIFRDGELLVTKFRVDNDSESEHWGTFGGGVDLGESLEAAIHREMIEETGIAPKVGRLLFVQQYDDNGKENMEFFFHIENTADYESVDLTATTHGHIELTRAAFVDPKKHNVKPVFLRDIDIKDYVENHRPVYFFTTL